MTRQISTSAEWDWGEQLIRPLQNIVERVGEYDPEDDTSDFEEMLLEPLSISGGESFTAEDHRGREILELLQNAQDAAGGLYEESLDPTIGTRGVYIGISEDGLLVANTGDAFDFNSPERRKSLRILGHSETSEETIGQFGVGLTSIRSMGEAYEVWTKAPDQAGTLESADCWRVFCGPRTTIAAIASAVPEARRSGASARAYQRFRSATLGAPEVLDASTDSSPLDSVPLSADQIPYFTYPVAMESWYEPTETSHEAPVGRQLRNRARDLLRYDESDDSEPESCSTEIQSLLSDVGSFTTAVFVDFEDADWRTLFEAITGTQPASPDENSLRRLENQAWFDNSEADRVTPELLLNLGNIDRLVVERFGDSAEEPSSLQSWEVFGRRRVEDADAADLPIDGREIKRGSGTDEVAVTEVAVQLETNCTHDHLEAPAKTDTATYTFWDAEFTDRQTYGAYDWYDPSPTGEGASDDADADEGGEVQPADRDIEVSLLLHTADSDRERELYEPHLYYPISGAEKQFPYCIHGDFAVQQNRQSLAGSAVVRNCAVAKEAARLVGQLSETLATAAELTEEERSAIPWRLLPTPLDNDERSTDWPTATDIADQNRGRVPDNEPLRVLRADIYRRLQDQNNIQTVSEGGTQSSLTTKAEAGPSVLLYHDPTVVAGISALFQLVTLADEELDPNQVLERSDAAVDVSLPTESTLDALLRWLVVSPSRSGLADTATAIDDSESDRDLLPGDLLREVQSGVSADRATRLEQLVADEGADTDLAAQLITPWWTVLQTWSQIVDDETDVGCAITDVPSGIGQTVLQSLVTLGADVDTFPNGAAFTPLSDGPYLLPCDSMVEGRGSDRLDSDNTERYVQLVRAESHETQGDHQRQVLRPGTETIEEIAPPAETGFALYLLSETTSPESSAVIEDANWGTREYGGPAGLYRTLLRDVTNWQSDLSIADLRFLVSVYGNINFDSRTAALDAVEGGYLPRDEVGRLARKSSAVDNLKPRVDARKVSIPATLLKDGGPATARTIRFGDELLKYWFRNHYESPDEEALHLEEVVDSNLDQLSAPPVRSVGPVATLPPEEERDGLVGVSPAEIATQLGMLGVSVLPGIQTLLLRGDDAHPDRQTISSWDPRTWTAEDDGRLRKLQTVLETTPGETYLDLLTTPVYGPGESSTHTTHCDVKDYPREGEDSLYDELERYGVAISSWVWLPPNFLDDISAPELANLLETYGEALSDSLLVTGWSCDNGRGNTNGIDTFVPSLLNWQLRTVTNWDDVEWFYTPTVDGLWTNHDEWGLQYAVLEENVDGRSTAASVFPRIDPAASPIPESVWNTLGVKALEELNATEAALRLDALIEAASSPGSAPDTFDRGETYPVLELSGIEAVDAWQTLSGTLLGAIGAEIDDRSEGMTLEKLQFLDRVPARTSDGSWVGLTPDALDTAVYYDSTESDWENRLAQLEDDEDDVVEGDDRDSRTHRYLLPRPVGRTIKEDEFEALWKSTAATKKPAQYPEIDRSETIDADGSALQDTLSDPEIRYGVLAAAPGKEAQTEHRNKYDTITATLRRIDHSSTDERERETAWRVTPLDTETGLDLENVDEESKYAVAFGERTVDPEEPVSLADLFVALYDGGNKDSYKLALLGRDVEGKDTVREELRTTDVQELETDLRLSAALIDSDLEIERGMLTIPDETDVRDLRNEIEHCLIADDSLPPETETALDEPVRAAVTAMCTTDSKGLRGLAGKLVDPSNPRDETLESFLRTKSRSESPSKPQLTAVERLEATLSSNRSSRHSPEFTDLLPNGMSRQVAESLHELISGMQRSKSRITPGTVGIDDLREHSTSLAWADRIFSPEEPGESLGYGPRFAALTDAVPDDYTWFHLAWWLDTADQPPTEIAPVAAVLDTVCELIGWDPDEHRDELLAKVRSSGYGREMRSSSSSGEFTESDNTTLFDQIGTEADWEYSSDGLHSGFSASTKTFGSGSGGGAPIDQSTDQPRVAELKILQLAYGALVEADLPEERIDTVEKQLAAMQWDDNEWRTDDGWKKLENFSVDALPDPDELGRSEMEFPTVAFDITGEGEFGYDILDLTGWAIHQADDVSVPSEGVELGPYRESSTLTPVPVEVKTVDPENPSFKFSLNQYQSAAEFVTPVGEDGAVPYVLFLVEVGQDEENGEPRYSVDPYETIVITCLADLRQLLPSELSPNENDSVIDTLIFETIYGGDLMISE